MLTYLSDYRLIRNIGNRSFELRDMLSLKLPKEEYREHHSYTISFEEKSLHMYSYDESHHNGDHYNCLSKDIDFDNILSIFNALEILCRKKLEKQIEKEKSDKQKLEEEKIIDDRMKVMF